MLPEGAFERLLERRIVFLGTEIDDKVANVVIAQLLYLENADKRSPVDLYVNSPGGVVTSSLAICDAMEALAVPVRTSCLGDAVGTAALIVAHAARGCRAALPEARLAFTPISLGSSTEVARAEAEKLKELMISMLAADTGQPASRIAEDMARSRSFDPEAARAYGLIDRVLPPPERGAH